MMNAGDLARAVGSIAVGAACLAQCAVVLAEPATYYVSREGNDAWPGTEAQPFATLERARDAIRALRAEGAIPPEGAMVIVRGGAYELAASFELTQEDSGTPEAPITYRAADGEEVRLVGGRTLSADAFGPVTDAALLERAKPESREHLVQADLHALGVGELPAYPTKYRGAPAVPELFYNDRRMNVSRWPNQGWATIARIVDSGSRPRDGDNANKPGIFEYAEDAPSRWNVEAGVWLNGYWCYDWYEETIRVGAIDPATRQITLAEPSLYSVMQGNPSPRRYRALNVLEELDQAGEYYLDAAGGRLVFWPPKGVEGARIVLSMLSGPIVSVRDASHVRLRGFFVEATLGDAIVVAGGTDVRVQACGIRNTRQIGVRVEGGTAHRIEACDIYDTGAGGLSLAGGDRKTLTPAGHEAVNNHIHDYSQLQFTYANAMLISGVGNRAAHNLIYGAPHQAIGIDGNDHIFELNVIHHICMETDDCGAYYKGRNPSSRGNIVRHNFWHNIGSPMGHGNAAVYFDDGDGGDTVYGNVFYRCGEPGKGPFGTVFSHGGHGITADNNVFIDCKRALGSAPWDDARWADAIHGGQDCGWTEKLLQEVDITKPPYTTRYPELIGFMDPQPGAPRVSSAKRNVFVRCGEVGNGNWQWSPDENLVLDHDPGFVDAAGGDFALRPDSEVFTKLPGFEPIPFEQMGLYADELRPELPVEQWAGAAAAPEPLDHDVVAEGLTRFTDWWRTNDVWDGGMAFTIGPTFEEAYAIRAAIIADRLLSLGRGETVARAFCDRVVGLQGVVEEDMYFMGYGCERNAEGVPACSCVADAASNALALLDTVVAYPETPRREAYISSLEGFARYVLANYADEQGVIGVGILGYQRNPMPRYWCANALFAATLIGLGEVTGKGEYLDAAVAPLEYVARYDLQQASIPTWSECPTEIVFYAGEGIVAGLLSDAMAARVNSPPVLTDLPEAEDDTIGKLLARRWDEFLGWLSDNQEPRGTWPAAWDYRCYQCGLSWLAVRAHFGGRADARTPSLVDAQLRFLLTPEGKRDFGMFCRPFATALAYLSFAGAAQECAREDPQRWQAAIETAERDHANTLW